MANQKISQMPASAALTGSELVEVVQAGVNVQTTAAALGATALQGPANSVGSPSLTLAQLQAVNSLLGNTHWFTTASLGTGSIPAGSSDTNGNSGSFSTVGVTTITGQALTPGAASVSAAVLGTLLKTAASANSNLYLYSTAAQAGNGLQQFRQVSAGPIAGFSFTFYVWVAQLATGQSFFCGASNAAIGGAGAISSAPNILGFGKDAGDTNLQLMYNNGAGSATKTDTGIPYANLLNHMLRITVSCDGSGNVQVSLADLEPTGNLGTLTYQVAAATAKLPAQNTSVMPLLAISAVASAAIAAVGFHSVFCTTGFAT
jgi:hypothetical protein